MALPKMADHVAATKRGPGRPRRTTPTVAEARRAAELREVTLTVTGAPRTKKNSRRHVKGRNGNIIPLPSKAFSEWQRRCAITPELVLPDARYNVRAIFYRDAERGDACGYYQGLSDLLQHYDVISNDKWLVSWDGSRLAIDRDNPRVEVTLTPIGD
jgi:hypothetical protein